jgi:hypothetical protein
MRVWRRVGEAWGAVPGPRDRHLNPGTDSGCRHRSRRWSAPAGWTPTSRHTYPVRRGRGGWAWTWRPHAPIIGGDRSEEALMPAGSSTNDQAIEASAISPRHPMGEPVTEHLVIAVGLTTIGHEQVCGSSIRTFFSRPPMVGPHLMRADAIRSPLTASEPTGKDEIACLIFGRDLGSAFVLVDFVHEGRPHDVPVACRAGPRPGCSAASPHRARRAVVRQASASR